MTDQNYSTTPASARTPLSDNDNSSAAKNARAGVLSVACGNADPTGGAVLWDGTDFFMKGSTHNKFKEYSRVTIWVDALQTYSLAQKGLGFATFRAAIAGKTSYTGVGRGMYFSLQSTGPRQVDILDVR